MRSVQRPPTPDTEPEKTVAPPSSNVEVIENHPERDGPVEVLLRLAASARFFRSADGRLYAQVPVARRREIHGLASVAFREWLSRGYWGVCLELPSDRDIHRVLDALEAIARFEDGTPSTFIRVGHDGKDKSNGSPGYLDLGDPTGQAIELRPDGWSLVERPPVHFRRPDGLLPLPVPCRDASIDLLRPFVNLTEPDFRLLIAWLAAALRPFGPYPILVLYGEQPSAKSTLARILRLLIDPQARPFLAEPKNTRDMMVAAGNGWLLAYDHIRVIPGWLSDRLCRLVFGAGFGARALFQRRGPRHPRPAPRDPERERRLCAPRRHARPHRLPPCAADRSHQPPRRARVLERVPG